MTKRKASASNNRLFGAILVSVPFVWCAVGCGGKKREQAPAAQGAPEVQRRPLARGGRATSPEPGTPADLPHGLLVSYSQFEVENGEVTARPGPALLNMVYRSGGSWRNHELTDPVSNVFHKAIFLERAGQPPSILTFGGTAAAVKRWSAGEGGGLRGEILWKTDFGGRFSRMRDAEVADLVGDAAPEVAVATHDQGVVALLVMQGDAWAVRELDRRPNTIVHEVEVGDLDGDGVREIYATPSEPNDFSGGEQRGRVVRYVPRKGQGRTVVADLGNRHAKEILVGDVDGDGRDELYVAVEALTSGRGASLQIEKPVEIRRYEHDTPPDAGVVIATLPDRLCRFLTAGDFDGDGRKEMVAAAFKSGLWLLRPGRDARGEWGMESLDRESAGFEHAALAADLDGDGAHELYVAADAQGELRRYVWRDGRPAREVLLQRSLPRSRMTWNLMPAPRAFLESAQR